MECAFPNVETLCCDFIVPESPDQFELGIVDGSSRVSTGGQQRANGGRERVAPNNGPGVCLANPVDMAGVFHNGDPGGAGLDGWGREPHPAGSCAGRVVGALEGRTGGHEFLEPGRPGGELVVEPAEIGQCVVETWGEAQTAGYAGFKSHLEVAEKTLRSREGEGHGAKLSQQFVVGVQGEAFACGGNGREELLEAVESPSWEGDGERDSVDNPPQDFFAGGPTAIAF